MRNEKVRGEPVTHFEGRSGCLLDTWPSCFELIELLFGGL